MPQILNLTNKLSYKIISDVHTNDSTNDVLLAEIYYEKTIFGAIIKHEKKVCIEFYASTIDILEFDYGYFIEFIENAKKDLMG
jgi:hypothetical protein